jgi:hypothetical protein
MAATLQWYQTNGAAPGNDTPQSQTDGVNNWDFKSLDTVGPAVAGEEITAGSFSMHVYAKVRFTGSFSSIDNVLFYASNLNVSGFGIGAYILASGIEVGNYTEPSVVSKSGTWSPVPIVAGNGQDIGTPVLVAGTAGFTDYVALQLKTTTSGAEADFGGYTSFTVVYDEV